MSLRLLDSFRQLVFTGDEVEKELCFLKEGGFFRRIVLGWCYRIPFSIISIISVVVSIRPIEVVGEGGHAPEEEENSKKQAQNDQHNSQTLLLPKTSTTLTETFAHPPPSSSLKKKIKKKTCKIGNYKPF